MSSALEVEALLDQAEQEAKAKAKAAPSPTSGKANYDDRHDRHARDRERDRERRDRERSRSPRRRGGDHYSSRYHRTRSPERDRYYRPGNHRDRSPSPRGYRDRRRSGSHATPPPPPNADERDKRTIFVQQLAASVESRHLKSFFQAVGPVVEAQVVRDRVSQRSKGVGYVEFAKEESVQKALGVTGQKLKGIPVIVSETQAEKNRQAKAPAGDGGSAAPFHRLYVGNIHFNITLEELQSVFEVFGPLESIHLETDEKDSNRSKGHAQVQYVDPEHAKEALSHLNGHVLAGRAIRVGLGNSRFNDSTTKALLQQFDQKVAMYKVSGGARRPNAGGRPTNAERAAPVREDKVSRNVSALDDTDIMGLGYTTYNRDALMRKLARTEPTEQNGKPVQPVMPQQAPVAASFEPTRSIKISNAFDTKEEEEKSVNWVKELEEDIETQCNEDYGQVVHIAVDPQSDGDVYVRFAKPEFGKKALEGLNGRYFNQRRLAASPIRDGLYQTLYGRGKPLP